MYDQPTETPWLLLCCAGVVLALFLCWAIKEYGR